MGVVVRAGRGGGVSHWYLRGGLVMILERGQDPRVE